MEDFGASPFADKFGIDKYPAVFVDDTLVAHPEDFYVWGGAGKGRYIPWGDLESRRKFQTDLRRMIDIRLAGGTLPVSQVAKASGGSLLPAITLTDLQNNTFRFADLKGKPTLIEFWATWCPPCLETMKWLRRFDADRVNIVAISVQSERKHIDAVLERDKPPGRFVIGSPETLEAFGGLPGVPALFIADAEGRIVKTFFGAPPTLHGDIEKELKRLTQKTK